MCSDWKLKLKCSSSNVLLNYLKIVYETKQDFSRKVEVPVYGLKILC